MTDFMRFPLMSVAVGALALTIFTVDAFTTLDIAIASMYGVVILWAGALWSRRTLLAMACLCFGLTLLAYVVGHRTDLMGSGFGRCVVSLTAITIIAFLTLRRQTAKTALQQRQEELRQMDQRKDEFLAMLAHELRNPLAPISAAAELLKFPSLPTEQVTETCEIVVRQVGHMTSLIDDLLDVSRVTRGIVTLDMKRTDMHTVVKEAVEQVRPQIDARSQHLELDITFAPAEVMGDHKRLVQAVANLLGNATKYTPEKGQLRLRLEVVQDRVEVSVTDTGVGIAADLLPQIFELFTQAKRGSDRAQGGLGIGLALVKALVELHGGQVSAHSAGDNQGSTFMLALDVLLQDQKVAAIPPKSSAMQQNGEALRILLVDDNADALKMLALYLQNAGYEPQMARNGMQALELAGTQHFDVFMLDIGLPGMDGHELIRQLKQLPHAEKSLFMAITGYGRHADRRTALESGFDHHLVKPVNPTLLVDLLNCWHPQPVVDDYSPLVTLP